MDAEGWTITLDMRPDHSVVWDDLHKLDVRVMTHVMEIRRSDGAAFTAQEASRYSQRWSEAHRMTSVAAAC